MSPTERQSSSRIDTGRVVALKRAKQSSMPRPALFSVRQLRMTILSSTSSSEFGSKSMPASGGAPFVSCMTVFSMRSPSTDMTLMPWRQLCEQTHPEIVTSRHGRPRPAAPR